MYLYICYKHAPMYVCMYVSAGTYEGQMRMSKPLETGATAHCGLPDEGAGNWVFNSSSKSLPS